MKSVLIVGAGKVGTAVASALEEAGHRIVVLEARADHAEEAARRLPGSKVTTGSATDPADLEIAGIRTCDVLVALTGSDEANLVVCSLGKFEFGVDRVIARVVDPRNAWMYDQDIGVDAALDQSTILGHLVVEELDLGDLRVLLTLRRGSLELVEEKVTAQSPVLGRQPAELELPGGSLLIGVIRRGTLVRPAQAPPLAPEDELLAIGPAETAADLAAALGARR
ncbi:MAG TPA: NAD-binding protein [Acidimicrobiia bacterium]